MHEVVGPDVVRPLGTQPDAGAVVQPEPTPLRLFAGHLQPLASPQALDPLVVDLPAGVPQQGRNPPIAVTTVPAGQFDHVRDQAVLVVTAARGTTLGRAMLTQHPAGTAPRGPEPVTNMVDALATTRGAQKFPCAASFRTCLSSVRSRSASGLLKGAPGAAGLMFFVGLSGSSRLRRGGGRVADVPARNALHRRPRFDRPAIHREVLVRQQTADPRAAQNRPKEARRHITRNQTVAVLRMGQGIARSRIGPASFSATC